MVDFVQKIAGFLTCLIIVGSFCQSVEVRSYVLPPLDSTVPSKCGDSTLEQYLASIPEAQRALGIGRSTAYRLMDAGKLEKVKIAGEGQRPSQGDPE